MEVKLSEITRGLKSRYMTTQLQPQHQLSGSHDQKGVSVEQSGYAVVAAGAVKSLVTVGVDRYGMPCRHMFLC